MQITMKYFEMVLNEKDLTKADIDYLKAIFNDINPGGRELVSIQVGWIFYYLVRKDGKYQLMVNDFCDPDLETTDELEPSLTIPKEQLRFLKSYQMNEEKNTFHQKIVCDKDVLNGNAFYMERTLIEDESDSGWFIGYLDEQHEVKYEAFYAYELLHKKPYLIPFLLAPVGTLIVIKEDAIVSVVNDKNEELSGSGLI